MYAELQKIKEQLVESAKDAPTYGETMRWFDLLNAIEVHERKFRREDKKSA